MTEPISLQAVVFDLDGLVVNTEDLYEQAGNEVLRRRGKTHDLALREQMMGRPAADAIRVMIEYHSLDDTVEALIAESAEVLVGLLESSLETMPGAKRLLDALAAARMPAAMATSATRQYAADIVRRVGLADRFAFVLSAEDIQHGKPAPDVYRLAAERLGLPPAQTMVLEDSANGCRAGVAAGAFTVAVPNRHTCRHNFDGVQLVADTLEDPRIYQALRIQ